MTDVYERLAGHLDTTPAGYPRTASGVELRILRRLFTPEEADLALHLTVIAEEPRVVARRARRPVADTARRLEEMERKGLILSEVREGVTRYMVLQFVVGVWEAQVNKLTPDLVRDFEEYLPTLFDPEAWSRTRQMRVVPVNASIEARGEVLPHELVAELVREGAGHYAVSNCICRQERRIGGEGCNRPMESCLTLGTAADLVTRSGRGRAISREEMLDILQLADEAGLVLQAANARRAVFICTCCGCCCGVLRSLKRHPSPARIVSTPFVASLAAETCEGCAACEARCQMDALRVVDGRAALDAARCIGCGLCVSTCPSGSLRLARKPDAEQPAVAETLVASYMEIGRARGRFGVTELAGLKLRSVVDRFLA
jgi:Na+-translocating ferredoxin:NAD+ oxidoreductase subunit B